MTGKKIILASTSPIRKQMLYDAGVGFEIINPLCDEEKLKESLTYLTLDELALELAKGKAKSISDKYKNCYVIGSDQICELEGEVISKSKNFEQAFDSLKKLQGKTHKQNNGTCIYYNGKPVMEHKESVMLTMKKPSDKEIEEYIKLDNPIGCAGSYKFELNGYKLFSKIEGTEECIKGFIVSKVKTFLETT